MERKDQFRDIVSIGGHNPNLSSEEFVETLSKMHRQKFSEMSKIISNQEEEIKSLKAQLEEVKYFSTKDALTNVFNRRFLENIAPKIITNEMRDQRSWGVLMVDIDYFKKVNDLHGHPAGDAVLQNVAKMLQHITRDGDFVIRYGGEEFLVLVFNINIIDIEKLAHRYRTAIAATETIHCDNKISVSASIGVCFVPGNSVMQIDEAIALADKVLYRAKDRGRNRVELCTDQRKKA